MLRRVQFCPQNMQCPSVVWESENLTKTNVIQKLWSKPSSTRSVLTSKTCWSCFFTIPPFVQTLSTVLQLADSEPAFRCKIVNYYCLCCRTEKTGNNCSKKPLCLRPSMWQHRDIAAGYYLALDAGKYCQNNYQVLFISVDTHRRCPYIISITNQQCQCCWDSLRTHRFIPCLIPLPPWSKVRGSLTGGYVCLASGNALDHNLKTPRKICITIKPLNNQNLHFTPDNCAKTCCINHLYITYLLQSNSWQKQGQTLGRQWGRCCRASKHTAETHTCKAGNQPLTTAGDYGLVRAHLYTWLSHLGGWVQKTTPDISQSVFSTGSLVKSLQEEFKSKMVFCIQLEWIV